MTLHKFNMRSYCKETNVKWEPSAFKCYEKRKPKQNENHRNFSASNEAYCKETECNMEHDKKNTKNIGIMT